MMRTFVRRLLEHFGICWSEFFWFFIWLLGLLYLLASNVFPKKYLSLIKVEVLEDFWHLITMLVVIEPLCQCIPLVIHPLGVLLYAGYVNATKHALEERSIYIGELQTERIHGHPSVDNHFSWPALL